MTVKIKKRFSLLLLTFVFLVSLLSGCTSQTSEPAADSPSSKSEADSSKPTVKILASYGEITFDGLLERAASIVYGEISRIQPAQERYITPDKTQVYTPIKITPIETLKGDPGPTLLYNRIGGEYEGVIYRLESYDFSFQEGDRIFIFMGKYDSALGPTSISIEHDGMLTVWDEKGVNTMEMPTQEYIAKVKAALAEKGLQ